MSKKYAPCKKSCCWNPFGTCSRGRTCACHIDLRSDAQRQADAMRAIYAEAEKVAKKPAANVTPLFKEPEHGTS